jgi:antitoxin YokJ
MKINNIILSMKADLDCRVEVPVGIPYVPHGLILPQDLLEFYQKTGGVVFFEGKDYSIEIVPPSDLVRANPVIVNEDCIDDISYNWFIIGRSGNQYITIDLDAERLGRCYDSFWDCHGLAGDCAVVAQSFTELLEQLWKEKGEYLYWLTDSFPSLGDAYDLYEDKGTEHIRGYTRFNYEPSREK